MTDPAYRVAYDAPEPDFARAAC